MRRGGGHPAAVAASVLLLAPPAIAAESLSNVAVLQGQCTLLYVVKGDTTRACHPTLTNEVYRSGRVAFTYSAGGGSTFSFSGSGARQVKLAPDLVVQPIDRVIFQFDVGVPPHTLAAVGKCRYSNPYRGKATVECEASAAEGEFRASFATNGKPPVIRDF